MKSFDPLTMALVEVERARQRRTVGCPVLCLDTPWTCPRPFNEMPECCREDLRWLKRGEAPTTDEDFILMQDRIHEMRDPA